MELSLVMESERDREVFLIDKHVVPGYLYDTTTETFSSSKEAENLNTEDLPVRFNLDFWDKKQIDNFREKFLFEEDPRVKNYVYEKPVDAFMVNGDKILEKRGIGVPLDSEEHRVTSIIFKSSAYLLMIFSQSVPKEHLEKLDQYLSSAVENSNESDIPQMISDCFKCAYIYPNIIDAGERVTGLKHSLNRFCRILTESHVSISPTTALIKAPWKPLADGSCRKVKSVDMENDDSIVCFTMDDAHNNTPSSKSIDEVPQLQSEMSSGQTGKDKGHEKRQNLHDCDTDAAENTVIERRWETKKGKGYDESASPHRIEKDEILNISFEGENETNHDHFQKDEKLPDNLQSNLGFSCTSMVSDPGISIIVKNDGINNSKGQIVDQQSKKRERVKESESKVWEFRESDIGQSTPQTRCCNDASVTTQSLNHNETRDSSGTLNQDPQKEKVFTVREESPELIFIKSNNRKSDLRKQYSNKNKIEKEENSTVDYEKDGKATKEKVWKRTKKDGVGEVSTFNQRTFRKKAKKELKRHNKIGPGKDLQINKKDELVRQKPTTTLTHQKKKDPVSISKKRKRSCKQVDTDDTNESSVLKVTAEVNYCVTKKQKIEKEKQKDLKSKLLKPEKTIKDTCGLERKYYGVINDQHPEKVILFLGASGSGKTTLINFIANYFLGKKTADDELIHVENTTPTSAITAYTFCSSLDEIPITIIDTPGLNDSSGAEIRDHVQSLKLFLANASSKGLEIHAIGFVAQAYLVRLTSSERLVMDYVSTMFGQSVSEHLITLVTFADNQDNPPIVEAMKNYGVNSKLFLKFNNSTLSNTKSDEIDDLDKAYWRVCWRNWRKCLKTLRDLSALGVNTMKAIQSEIYAATVIESAERDLRAELMTFFTYCKTENFTSSDALQVCQKIWELAAIVHHLRHAQDSASCNLENIIVELSVDTCRILGISPEKCVSNLSLCPSGPLVVSGSEIVCTMAPLYEFTKNSYPDSGYMSKSITEWAHCLVCNDEHKMERYRTTGLMGYIPGIGPGENVLTLKCVQCECPGDAHVVSTVTYLFHVSDVLIHTTDCLYKALNQYSLPGFPVQQENLLKFLDQHFNFEHQVFIVDLLKMVVVDLG